MARRLMKHNIDITFLAIHAKALSKYKEVGEQSEAGWQFIGYIGYRLECQRLSPRCTRQAAACVRSRSSSLPIVVDQVTTPLPLRT